MSVSERPLRVFIMHASHNLTNHSPSGDGLVAWGYIAELARRGHRIHAVTDKLDVIGELPSNLTLIEFPRRSRNALLHYLAYMMMIRKFYRRLAATEGVDVVHQMNPVVRGLSLALVGMNVPIVLGTYVGDWKRLRSKPTYRPRNVKERFAHSFKLVLDALQQSQADVLALATPYAASRVPLSALRRNQIQFLHHGVDASLFSRAPQAGDPVPRPLSILCLGSVRYHKGTTTLIDAFRGVVAEIPQARLIFVGSGLMDEMKGRLRSYGLEDRAEFVGDSSRSEVAGWLRACSVLCAPSFGEPYGQNVLEAMATGKPIVATSEGGHPYLLDPSGGFRVQPGDTKALANALLAILRDPLQADRMGAYNRVIAEQRHDWAHVAGELEQLYRSAMSQRQRRARSFAAFRLKARA